ncbi:MAG: 16S rRNA (adenine(1518)-N(6)/adenine(1519)-N(6))-dimethyltransferase RsmA [bacterium]
MKNKNIKFLKNSMYDPKRDAINKRELRNLEDEEHDLPRKKKSLGQHFLRKQSVVDNMISSVTITPETSVMEIGCGDGFLTQAILNQTRCKQLTCFEIDPEWVEFVKNKIKDPRLTIVLENILTVSLEPLYKTKPLVLLANLPYQITFPIMFMLQKDKALFQEGVVMVQEEVAQKIVSSRGKTYGPTSMFLQYHFTFKLLEKIEPGSFSPPPKVHSRLIHFKPKLEVTPIKDEENFWKFLKTCFQFPRRTLRNNIKATNFLHHESLTETLLDLRAQQLSFEQFLVVWDKISPDLKTAVPGQASCKAWESNSDDTKTSLDMLKLTK